MDPPFAIWTDAVEPPRGEAKADWWIIDQICRRIGIVPSAVPAVRALGRIGIRMSPQRAIDAFMGLGPEGDLFGLRRGGLSVKALRQTPSGRLLADRCPTGVLAKRVRHKSGKVRLDDQRIVSEFDRIRGEPPPDTDDALPFRLISQRELRSQNTWYHNVDKLMRNRQLLLRIHPDDAASIGVKPGEIVTVTSKVGKIEVPVMLTDQVIPGVVSLPQGWGHRGGWRVAVRAGGASYNLLTSSDPDDLDVPSGNAVLNGIPVRIEAVCGVR